MAFTKTAGVVYGTPGLTLTTANASGSTQQAVRIDADLLVYDVTVPTDITAGGSAATGSAVTSARRDHVHGAAAATAAATQAEMELPSSTTVYVSPGRTQYHPGVGKAWAKVDQTGTQSLRSSYGISGIADDGVGKTTLTFTTAMDDAHGFSGSCTVPNGVGCLNSPATTTIRLDSRSYAGSLQDVDEIYAMFMGTQ